MPMSFFVSNIFFNNLLLIVFVQNMFSKLAEVLQSKMNNSLLGSNNLLEMLPQSLNPIFFKTVFVLELVECIVL